MASSFESFNAKNLSPLQVATTFIPPERQFLEICERSHSVVVGPRGSGKTTLLKMLQVQALAAWNHPRAREYIARIDFNAVFVPADIVWQMQMRSLFGERTAPEAAKRLSVASFTTHVLSSLIGAFESAAASPRSEYTKRFHVVLSPRDEAELVEHLSAAWKISPRLPSLAALRSALQQRIGDIASLVELLENRDPDESMVILQARPELYLTFYEQVLFAIGEFNRITKGEHRQWALLFDELEIAPELIRQKLIALLRGTDTRILLKLSMAPYNREFSHLKTDFGAKAGQDYTPITLWYSEKEDAIPFATELTMSMVHEAGLKARSIEALLGSSATDVARAEQRELGSAYAPGSSNHRRFTDLFARDPTFRAYLSQHRIDLRTMNAIDDFERAATIRKLTSVVSVREAYYRSAESSSDAPSRVGLRTRKRPQLYTGAAALLALTEGNPRWIIGTLGPLLKTHLAAEKVKMVRRARTGHRTSEYVSSVGRSAQAQVVDVVVNRFRSLLSTLPMSTVGASPSNTNILSVLDIIGNYFSHGVLAGPFKPEPPSTFRVDENVPAAVVDAIEVALNVGAVVLVSASDEDVLIESIRNSRFRITYLLAPHYRLPLTTGKVRDLSKILSNAASRLATPDLFDAKE